MKKISVITINYNSQDMTLRVLSELKAKDKGLNFEFIVIDNASKEKINENKFLELGVKLIRNKENLGFAKAVNQGIRETSGEYILLLNSDVIVENGAISSLYQYMEKNRQVAISGPIFNYPGGRYQISAGRFPNLWREFLRLSTLYKYIAGSTFMTEVEFNKNEVSSVDWLTGGCMLIRRELVEEIGLFDENYFLGVEDFDICKRAKRVGYKIIYYPLARVLHYHGYSSGAGGTKSIFRIKNDRDGINYFLKKHCFKKILSRLLIYQMHNIKIALIKLANKLNFRKNKKLISLDATIAVTYKCNSRCRMCNIWQSKKQPELPLQAFKNLSPSLKYINISGGEPFLRKDIIEVIKKVKKASPKAQIIISSNGLATDLILNRMKNIFKIDRNIGIRISIDGREETHDKIRGIKGIYSKAMQTIAGLQKLGVNNLGLSFTIMDENIDDLMYVYNLAKEKKLQLALALVQNSDIYFNKNSNKIKYQAKVSQALSQVIKSELKSRNLKSWLRAYYDYGLKYYNETNKRLIPSGAGLDSLFISPDGNIYPSNLINLPMGNIINNELNNIWESDAAIATRDKIIKEYISESWIICTIRGEMKKHLFKVLSWLVINKFKVITNKNI
ncbi:MAG: glycosyltransferase [Patescibacteria group bacterium]